MEKPLKKILIVDDEPDFTMMVKFNLESAGPYHVLVENRATSAINAALNFLPDVIILDIIMPEAEGPELLAQLREHPLLSRIPVIFLTATMRANEVDMNPPPSSDYVLLAKPGTVRELVDCIERLLRTDF